MSIAAAARTSCPAQFESRPSWFPRPRASPSSLCWNSTTPASSGGRAATTQLDEPWTSCVSSFPPARSSAVSTPVRCAKRRAGRPELGCSRRAVACRSPRGDRRRRAPPADPQPGDPRSPPCHRGARVPVRGARRRDREVSLHRGIAKRDGWAHLAASRRPGLRAARHVRRKHHVASSRRAPPPTG